MADRHCEERSDEAIHLRLRMTDGRTIGWVVQDATTQPAAPQMDCFVTSFLAMTNADLNRQE
jgi:hypothetical protein